MIDMSVLSELLVKNRFDYVVLDKYIFYYYFRLKNHNRDTSIFTEHNLIPQVPASIGFHDKNLRESFNKELSPFYHSKEYFKIIERYIAMGLIEYYTNIVNVSLSVFDRIKLHWYRFVLLSFKLQY